MEGAPFLFEPRERPYMFEVRKKRITPFIALQVSLRSLYQVQLFTECFNIHEIHKKSSLYIDGSQN